MHDTPAESGSAPVLKLGLLLCDDVPEDGRDRFGDYFGMFNRGLAAVEDRIVLTPYDAYKGTLPDSVTDQDGYLISGSSASVFEDQGWIHRLMQFVRDADEAGVKIAGICFGHQLIAHALGGQTVRSGNGWGFGIHSAKIDTKPDWLETSENQYRIVVIHQDQVDTLPPGFSTLASNDFCPHSMISNGRNMLGIQGHPEFDKAYCQYRAEFRREILGEEKYAEALSLLQHHELDSGEVFGWLRNFFRQPTTSSQPEAARQSAV